MSPDTVRCSRGIVPRAGRSKPFSCFPVQQALRSRRPGRRAPATSSRGTCDCSHHEPTRLGVAGARRPGRDRQNPIPPAAGALRRTRHRLQITGAARPGYIEPRYLRLLPSRTHAAWCSWGASPRPGPTKSNSARGRIPPRHPAPTANHRGGTPRLHRATRSDPFAIWLPQRTGSNATIGTASPSRKASHFHCPRAGELPSARRPRPTQCHARSMCVFPLPLPWTAPRPPSTLTSCPR